MELMIDEKGLDAIIGTKERFRALKQVIKLKAKGLGRFKRDLRDKQRKGEAVWREQGQLFGMRRDFRHYHIAYCEMKGRTRRQIERPGPETMPVDEKVIQEIKNKVYGI